MNLKKKFSRVTSIALALTLAFSMTGCGKDEKKKESSSKMDIATIETKMEENTSPVYDDIVAMLDDTITYEEFDGILSKIPSMKGTIGIDFDMSISADGESSDMSLFVDGEYGYDAKSKSAMMKATMGTVVDGVEDEDVMPVEMYIQNEDGIYYVYSNDTGDMYRTTLGSLEEAFGDGLPTQDLVDALELGSVDELKSLFEESDGSLDMSMFTLSKDTVDKNGVKCYELKSTFNMADYLDEIKNDEDVKALVEDMDMGSVDELLATELYEGTTVEDLLKEISFDATIYVHAEDFYITSMEFDLTKAATSICNFLSSYLGAMLESEVSITVSNAKVSYTCSQEDVTVKYTGEWEEYEYYDYEMDMEDSTVIYDEDIYDEEINYEDDFVGDFEDETLEEVPAYDGEMENDIVEDSFSDEGSLIKE